MQAEGPRLTPKAKYGGASSWGVGSQSLPGTVGAVSGNTRRHHLPLTQYLVGAHRAH